jgi:hypothetical protein
MAEVVNLRMRRKQDRRRRDEAAAAANRLAHGVGKGEREATRRRRTKAARDLDQHRRDPDSE